MGRIIRPDPATTGPVAVIADRDGLDLQSLLSDAAARWREAGARVVGVLAENGEGEGPCSAAVLRDITSGYRFSIQLDAAPAGTQCHLDMAGIDEACDRLLPQMAGADVVVLSKFGKTEAAGGGLWPAFSRALSATTPLLTTVSSRHNAAWTALMPGAARLEPDPSAIERWWHMAKARPPG